MISGTELHQTKAALDVSENQAKEYERNIVELQEKIARLTLELQKSAKPTENSSEV